MRQLQLTEDRLVGGTDAVRVESKRVPLERKVILKFHHFGGFFIEYSANISLTGMFIKTEAPKLPGSIFIFEIWLGDEQKLVHGLGEVMWVRMEEEGPDRPSGMGIRFLKIDDESRAVVQRVIAEHVDKGGSVFDLGSGTGSPIGDGKGRADLELVESGAVESSPGEQLQIDEALLGFDRPSDQVAVPDELVFQATDSGPRISTLLIVLLLVALAVGIGGTAFLFSADLLPF